MENKETNENKFSNLLDIVSNSIYEFIHKINKFIGAKKNNNIVKTIIRVICGIVIIVLLEIPFFLVGKFGEGCIYLFDIPFSNLIENIWCSVIEYSYLIFSLFAILKIIVDVSNRKELNFEIKKSKYNINNLYYIIKLVLIVIIEIALIPLYLLCTLLFAILGMIFGLLTHGIYTFGPLLMVVGLLIIIIFLGLYIHDIINDSSKGGLYE